jgi:hypothetical protein
MDNRIRNPRFQKLNPSTLNLNRNPSKGELIEETLKEKYIVLE